MKLHPAIVQFPVALLFVSVVLAIIALFTKRKSWKEWMFKNLVLGLLFIPLAIIAGLVEEQNLQHNEAIHSVLTIHKYSGFVILLVYSILTLWFWRRKNSMKNGEYTAWVLSLLLATGLLSYQGYLGGKMVFDLGAGVKPMEESMKAHIHGDEDEGSPSHQHVNEGKESSDTSSHTQENSTKEHSGDGKEASDSIEAQKKKKKELKEMKY